MDHADHVALIRAGAEGAGRRWLELGAGRGAFTLALADLLGDAAEIVAVDRDGPALVDLAREVRESFPAVNLTTEVADFTVRLPGLAGSFDGVLMANSLHFVRDKLPVVAAAVERLRPGGRFVLVEYDSDRGNPWVPWAIGYRTWELLAARAGLRNTRRIGQVPSRFLGSIYAAASDRA